MEYIVKNPGLQHIMKTTLTFLDTSDIVSFRLVNQDCKKIVDDPIFLLKYCLNLEIYQRTLLKIGRKYFKIFINMILESSKKKLHCMLLNSTSVNLQDEKCTTPIYLAARNGHHLNRFWIFVFVFLLYTGLFCSIVVTKYRIRANTAPLLIKPPREHFI